MINLQMIPEGLVWTQILNLYSSNETPTFHRLLICYVVLVGNPNADLGVPDSSSPKSSSPPSTDGVKKDTTTSLDVINGTQKSSTTSTSKKTTTSTSATTTKTTKNATPKKHRATQAEREPLVSSRDDKDRRQKEAALRHKLRSYEMFLALKEGANKFI